MTCLKEPNQGSFALIPNNVNQIPNKNKMIIFNNDMPQKSKIENE